MSDSSEKVCFAQVDGNLDTNPKIRKAGSVFATAIFEFLLRRVAVAHSNGTVPIRYIDPDYLADMLMMSCDDARHGTSRAVTADLIAIDDESGLVYIVGWTGEWGRRPKSGAERTQSWRERNGLKPVKSSVTNGDETSSHVTLGDESDVSEEKRREKKRRDPDPASPEAVIAADALRAEVVAKQPGHRLSREWPGKTQAKWARDFDVMHRRDGRAWSDIAALTRWLFHEQSSDFAFVVQSPHALAEKWDRIEAVRHRPPPSNGNRPHEPVRNLTWIKP